MVVEPSTARTRRVADRLHATAHTTPGDNSTRIDLRDTCLHRANLTDADLDSANLTGVNLDSADLSGAYHDEATVITDVRVDSGTRGQWW